MVRYDRGNYFVEKIIVFVLDKCVCVCLLGCVYGGESIKSVWESVKIVLWVS